MTPFAPLLLCALWPVQPSAEPTVEADVVLRGGLLVDGTGAAGVPGDLAIRGDRIVAVGHFAVRGSPRLLDVSGMVVAPGFIDLHTHSDDPLLEAETRSNYNYLTQGVTTVVTGNCGFGPVDVKAYFEKLEKGGAGTNVIHQVPHNDLRRAVMGNVNRPPTDAELRRMEELADRGFRDGAWGLSTGLIYNPGAYARTDELVALARVAARHGGHYASHIRNEGPDVLHATEEALDIARRAGVPVHISHMKESGRSAWGKSAEQVALVEQARAKGLVVTADQYPYLATSTSLDAIVVPAHFREGTQEEYLARLKDPEQRAMIARAVADVLAQKRDGADIRIASYRAKPAWVGKDLAAIAAQEGKTPVDIVLEIEAGGGAGIVNFAMSEEDVRLIMKRPWVATASDGSARVPSPRTMPHPRSYGCFPRKVGHYAIDEKVITLEFAVRSASGLPADILKLPQRGYLKPDYFADVVVFDPKKFRDAATYDKPHQYAPGVRHLFVNGKAAIADGKDAGVLAGRVLRHSER